MGTRPGQIDPGVVLYLIMQKGMDPAAVQNLLYRDSGLKGLSGISNDMRELQSNEEPRAKLAVDYFVHRAGLCTGMLAAALGGLDAFVFTAGIGENSPVIRSRIAEKLAWLGVELDDDANAAGGPLISTPAQRDRGLCDPHGRRADDRATYNLGSVKAADTRESTGGDRELRLGLARRPDTFSGGMPWKDLPYFASLVGTKAAGATSRPECG